MLDSLVHCFCCFLLNRNECVVVCFCSCMHVCVFQHLAIVDVNHLILEQLCQLTEENAVIQPLHQTVSCEVLT